METESSKRGGKRAGAGRPASEKTVQIRVPVGALSLVRGVVELYKAGLIPATEIKEKQVDWVESLKSAPKKTRQRSSSS